MEMLAGMITEVSIDRETIWQYADAPVGEALELVGGTKSTLESLSIMLEHIGGIYYPQASTSGVTPLMSP